MSQTLASSSATTAVPETDTAATVRTDSRRLRVRVAVILASVLAVLGVPLLNAAPANAAVAGCWNGRCSVYFSKSETRALAAGRVPAPPAYLDWRLRGAYYTFAYGHRWFAQQYANRGMCSAFTLDIRPWAKQGYHGYYCNWN